MEEPRQLDINIQLQEILDSIKNSESIKFLATPEQLQITNPQNYSGPRPFQMAPLNFPEDSLKMLIESQILGAKLNLSYVLLYSHIKNAVVLYSIWRSNELMLVEIKFNA
jgi:hypothetical protein